MNDAVTLGEVTAQILRVRRIIDAALKINNEVARLNKLAQAKEDASDDRAAQA
jgi:hypothetical protein